MQGWGAPPRALLSLVGTRDSHLRGLVSFNPGVTIVGPALTLRFRPKRGHAHDQATYDYVERELHRRVLSKVPPGDIVVVDAREHLGGGVFGEMMLTYFKSRK